MSRRPMPTEFGFSTGAYVPPSKPRPAWRTVLFAALLFLIPVVGPGMSAVYVDRRDTPEQFSIGPALVTALIQVIAVAALALAFWLIVVVLLGVSIDIVPRVTGRPG